MFNTNQVHFQLDFTLDVVEVYPLGGVGAVA